MDGSFHDAIVGRLLSTYVELDRAGSGSLDRSALAEAVAADDLSEAAISEVRGILAQIGSGDRVTYKEIYDHMVNSGWRPEITVPSVPFEGESTSRSTYIAHQLPKRAGPAAHAYTPSSGKFDGLSTSKEAYRAWPLPEPCMDAAPPSVAPKPFEGESTSRSTYIAHQLPKRAGPAARAYMPSPSRFDATSTSRESYKQLQLPSATMPMLGLLYRAGSSIGGKNEAASFFPLIAAHSAPPVEGRHTFTTVIPSQSVMPFRVVAELASGERLAIGTFELRGLHDGHHGARPLVSIHFHVDAEYVLTVTATDLESRRSAHIVMQRRESGRLDAVLRMPPPRDALGDVDLAAERSTCRHHRGDSPARSASDATASGGAAGSEAPAGTPERVGRRSRRDEKLDERLPAQMSS